MITIYIHVYTRIVIFWFSLPDIDTTPHYGQSERRKMKNEKQREPKRINPINECDMRWDIIHIHFVHTNMVFSNHCTAMCISNLEFTSFRKLEWNKRNEEIKTKKNGEKKNQNRWLLLFSPVRNVGRKRSMFSQCAHGSTHYWFGSERISYSNFTVILPKKTHRRIKK